MKKQNNVKLAFYAVVVATTVCLGLSSLTTGCNGGINREVSATQKSFDRLLAGEYVPQSELHLIQVSGPQPFAENWCIRHGFNGQNGNEKMTEIFKAWHNATIKLDKPISSELASSETEAK